MKTPPYLSESKRAHKGAIRAQITPKAERKSNYENHYTRKLQTAFAALKMA